MKKKALILGVTGQDGSYTADFLIKKNYEVHGMYRKSAAGNTKNIDHLITNRKIFNKNFFLHKGDLLDSTSVLRIIKKVNPNEIYNQADQDHVRWSYDMVGFSANVTAAAVANILEIIRLINPKIKYMQPCTSNMFGINKEKKQRLDTHFNPQSPYAVSKTFAYYITRFYRQTYGLHASNLILFNHESPRRPDDYVTRKITKSAAKIFYNKQNKISLGDINTKVDWGFSGDFVEAEWLALQKKNPDDYLICTGKVHSIKNILEIVFGYLNLDYKDYIKIDKKLIRPSKTSTLIGDNSKALRNLKWKPRTSFRQMILMMLKNDLLLEKNLHE